MSSVSNVVLAVSGGADSMALLYAMQTLKDERFCTARFICAHVNHQLRGVEADLDEAFVIAEASRLKLDVTTRRVDVRSYARDHKLSIETAARQCRMKALIEIAKENNCERIATAHQKNDNAETVLHRLIRGTGYRGLGGIWPKRVFADGVTFIRPMLCVTHEEVIEYLKTRKLQWRRDRTNTDCTFKRNYIRHCLLPALQRDCDDSLVEMLFGLSRSARRFYSRVCERADDVWPSLAECTAENAKLNLNKFQNESPPVGIELIRRSLDHLGCGQRDLTRRHYERIIQLTAQNITDGKIELPGKVVVQRDYEKLIFSRSRGVDRRVGFSPPVRLNVPGQTRYGKYLIEASIRSTNQNTFMSMGGRNSYIECFDLEKVKQPLSIRLHRPGDRFVPLGMAGEKKIGKFLTAQHVPHDIHRKIVLIEDQERIIWVWPIRISEQAKVTVGTAQILQLQITESDQ
ncbi:MAG: tRNA lysidine(34) synthetase TilS [Sedimentisphaerales bacterium]|nr:tRNA lysidine(34) synthetase TilS [Sedimentisphaerales bacterium]